MNNTDNDEHEEAMTDTAEQTEDRPLPADEAASAERSSVVDSTETSRPARWFYANPADL